VRTVETLRGPVKVATVYDLLFAQYGVSRGLPGEWPTGYDDPGAAYTPAWQERFTGVSAADVIRFAREWATTAEKTGGKCSVIIGAGVNQWYHGDHAYRAAIAGLVLCGCIGKNGGGLNHYVGQEKLAPVAPWSALAFALDWAGPPRLQNAPSFHYVHSDQWRYERAAEDEKLNPLPGPSDFATRHTMDHQARAVRMGWLPFFPQFDRTPTAVVHYTPELVGRKEHSIHIVHVASVSIDTNLLFSNVLIETTGGTTPVSCHGHRKADAIRMKQLIEQYQTQYYRAPAKRSAEALGEGGQAEVVRG